MSLPPNQPPTGGYPQSGEGGYNPLSGPPGSGGPSQSGWAPAPEPTQQFGQSPYGAPTGGYQPPDMFATGQADYGAPEPQWGQSPGYPHGGGYGPEPPKRSALPWIIGILVLLLVAGGVVLFFLIKDDTPPPIADSTSSSTSSSQESTDAETSDQTDETTDETTEDTSTPSATPEVGLPPPAGGPAPIGSGDTEIDALAQGCFTGDMVACDDLYKATAGPDQDNPDPSPELEPFFDYAFTCGDRLTAEEVAKRFCVAIWPDA